MQVYERDAGFKFYHYDPTTVCSVIFSLLFVVTALLHVWQLYRGRSWFLIPLTIGGLSELIGYAARCKSGSESPDWTLGAYIIQSLPLLVARRSSPQQST
ncbi:hypothetical protein EDB80DRAFT_882538 [Ilyonectria destructans]|nr:hypothetical protein EDB80DRAFT_882538 [Ilyonectria destructans]